MQVALRTAWTRPFVRRRDHHDRSLSHDGGLRLRLKQAARGGDGARLTTHRRHERLLVTGPRRHARRPRPFNSARVGRGLPEGAVCTRVESPGDGAARVDVFNSSGRPAHGAWSLHLAARDDAATLRSTTRAFVGVRAWSPASMRCARSHAFCVGDRIEEERADQEAEASAGTTSGRRSGGACSDDQSACIARAHLARRSGVGIRLAEQHSFKRSSSETRGSGSSTAAARVCGRRRRRGSIPRLLRLPQPSLVVNFARLSCFDRRCCRPPDDRPRVACRPPAADRQGWQGAPDAAPSSWRASSTTHAEPPTTQRACQEGVAKRARRCCPAECRRRRVASVDGGARRGVAAAALDDHDAGRGRRREAQTRPESITIGSSRHSRR